MWRPFPGSRTSGKSPKTEAGRAAGVATVESFRAPARRRFCASASDDALAKRIATPLLSSSQAIAVDPCRSSRSSEQGVATGRSENHGGGDIRLVHRVQQLERVKALARPCTPVDRFQRALEEASVRLTGKCADQLSDQSRELVMSDLRESFFRQLSETDSETLMTELAKIAFGDDTEALAAAEREVLASLDAGSQCIAVAPGRQS
jgi:hypothetical protein